MDPQIIATEKAMNFRDHAAWIRNRIKVMPNKPANRLLAANEGIYPVQKESFSGHISMVQAFRQALLVS